MATAADTFTSADLERVNWPDDWRVEVIDGELVVTHAHGWQHNHVAFKIAQAIDDWLVTGHVNIGIGVIYDKSDDVIPDVVWISSERFKRGLDEAGHLREVGPELVVEVVSPGRANARRDREAKLALYSRRDALEYWIVDPQLRTVHRHSRATVDEPLTLRAELSGGDALTSDVLTGFECSLNEVWA
jgi:Uma2 family endonuclease